ncbi:MAG TPA: alkaline phosphatase family protein [Verrucomicrobiae bacterium]|nr:alkaline phosphatase family protein [Verrucomicrobiae bacterium]
MSAAILSGCLFQSSSFAAGKAQHIVVVVWDGMRRDFATRENAPTLHQLIEEGVFFQNHHPVYPSTTEVNGTAIATGAYPASSRIVANTEYRPEIDPRKPVGTESLDAVRKGDLLARGHYVNMPTLAEILRANGRKSAIAGTKPVVLLHDRAARVDDAMGVNVYEGRTLPSWLHVALTNALGPFPEAGTNKIDRDLWTTRALVEQLWKDGVASFSLLWLAEPDYSQHATSPGTEQSLAAIRSSDRNLALVLDKLKEKGVYAETDVFIVSDHGFSTVERGVDLVAILNTHGFKAARQFKSQPAPGDILVVGGSSVLFYVIGHDTETIERLVDFLQRQDYAGVLFTRKPFDGTFTLKEARVDSPEAPDVVLSLRWTNARNPGGIEGAGGVEVDTAVIEARKEAVAAGQRYGTHGTLSPFDMRNTLVAAGPDFRRGFVNRLPSGNVDVAPTILWILGVKPPKPMDGRVLSEALTIAGPAVGAAKATRIEATNRQDGLVWRQYLKRTELNGVIYLDEANGAATLD